MSLQKIEFKPVPPLGITSEYGSLQQPVRLVICCSENGLAFGGKPSEMFVPVRPDTWPFGSTRNTGRVDTVQSRNKGVLLYTC